MQDTSTGNTPSQSKTSKDARCWIHQSYRLSWVGFEFCTCTDFRDLNKEYVKDDFPFPNIDMIVDITIRHEMLSLMDGFSGYNQIRMAEDQHKTIFTTPWGTFYYQVMPFGLKNTRATYQREMTTIFHNFLHKIMEDYVNALQGKSKTWEKKIPIPRKIFERLEKYKPCLNPKNCFFGITSKKILGFIFSHKGI